MAPAPAQRYLYSGQTVGASAQFHRLDDLVQRNLHVIPTLGASVLPVTGGLSKGHAANYCYAVDHPRRRNLLSVRHIDSSAEGRELDDRFETEIQAEIKSIHIVEKLHIELIQLHMLSTLEKSKTVPEVTTNGNTIQGMRLGKVDVNIVLDHEPLLRCGTQADLAAFYKNQSEDYRKQHAARFNTPEGTDTLASPNGHYKFSLATSIQLVNPEPEMSVEGYTIVWHGFGRIIIGEVVVKGSDRQLTMVRLAMGSDAAANGVVGCGRTNGSVSA
jgi:hypothetical protein